MKNLTYILVLAFMGVALSSCGYNTMVSKQEGVNSQWANVENAYQRRADLIPNLVATVKGYAEHEQETFTQVTEARAKATQMTVDPENLTEESIQQYQQAQSQLGSANNGLKFSTERYDKLNDYVFVKGPGNGRESAIRTIHGSGIEVNFKSWLYINN